MMRCRSHEPAEAGLGAWRMLERFLRPGGHSVLECPRGTTTNRTVSRIFHAQDRTFFLGTLAGGLALALAGSNAHAADTIKVGILHSLSGTMAYPETSLKDVALMTIEEINAKGGLLGKKLEAVVVDPASNWPLFAEKARELLQKEKVAVTSGCWTSVSRKSVLPVFEELNGLLFYPVQYEGEESSYNVFYTGAAPNQQAIPAVEYLMSEDGGVKRWVLLGTDYVYPRTTNKILRAFLNSKGVSDADIMETHAVRAQRLPDHRRRHQEVRLRRASARPWSRRSTAIPTCRSTRNSATPGLKATDVPVVAFSVGEGRNCAASTPSRWSVTSRPGITSCRSSRRRTRPSSRRGSRIRRQEQAAGRRQARDQRPDGGHLHRHPHVGAGGQKAGTTDVDAIAPGARHQTFKTPSAFESLDAKNHHLHKPVFIAEIQADGQFNMVWKTEGPIRAQAWSPVHPGQRQEGRRLTYPGLRQLHRTGSQVSRPVAPVCCGGSVPRLRPGCECRRHLQGRAARFCIVRRPGQSCLRSTASSELVPLAPVVRHCRGAGHPSEELPGFARRPASRRFSVGPRGCANPPVRSRPSLSTLAALLFCSLLPLAQPGLPQSIRKIDATLAGLAEDPEDAQRPRRAGTEP